MFQNQINCKKVSFEMPPALAGGKLRKSISWLQPNKLLLFLAKALYFLQINPLAKAGGNSKKNNRGTENLSESKTHI
jgi:hypothetical protein